ncbi:MAG: XRE family transcriptional regulator [Cytophagales bacterium]|nr:XRE family transcriptional regulator [Cytophagales bacterium]
MNIKDVMNNVKQIRLAKNWTQKYLADELEVTEATYGRYESGSINMKLEHFLKLGSIFNMPFEDIVYYNSSRPSEEKDKKLKKYVVLLEEKERKIMAMEQEQKYLTDKVATLEKSADRTDKYISLLEQAVKDKDGGKTEDSFKSSTG